MNTPYKHGTSNHHIQNESHSESKGKMSRNNSKEDVPVQCRHAASSERRARHFLSMGKVPFISRSSVTLVSQWHWLDGGEFFSSVSVASPLKKKAWDKFESSYIGYFELRLKVIGRQPEFGGEQIIHQLTWPWCYIFHVECRDPIRRLHYQREQSWLWD